MWTRQALRLAPTRGSVGRLVSVSVILSRRFLCWLDSCPFTRFSQGRVRRARHRLPRVSVREVYLTIRDEATGWRKVKGFADFSGEASTDDAVAALVLGLVELLVGPADQLARGQVLAAGGGGDAEADGDLERRA